MDLPLHMRGYPENPNTSFSKSPCDIASVTHALASGCDPNAQWEELDLVSPKSTGGCVINTYSPPGYKSWANWSTPLHKAMTGRHYDAAVLLLEAGAQIEMRNALGRTVLHEAVHEQDRKGVRFLIRVGANLDAETEARKLTDQYCDREGIAGLIPLHQAIANGDTETFRLLVDAGASIDHRCPGGWSLLDFALIERQVAILEILLVHGAKISSQDFPSGTETSVQQNYKNAARLLLASDEIIPPSSCRGAYLHLITQPAFLEDSLDPAQKSERLISAFFVLASSISESPNLEKVPGQSYCSHCMNFQQQARPDNRGPFKHQSDRSSLQTSARDGCALCTILEDALENGSGRWTEYSYRQQCDRKGALHVAVAIDFDSGGIKVMCEDKDATLEVQYLHDAFVFDPSLYSHDLARGTGSSLAFRFARSWLSICQRDHERCIKSDVHDPVLPTRVIEVGDESHPPRLYCSEGDRNPYCALSYCWGNTESLVLTRETLAQWTDNIPLSSLAPTFSNAIIAARELGLRYIWIDVLCAVQDNEDCWSDESSQTHNAFANATITLSAHDSKDVSEGLFRPRGEHLTHPVQLAIRVPQKYRARRHHLQNHNCMFVLPVQAEKALLKPGPVQQRGWTLQQHALSTRILHFGAGILYWECLDSHASESDLQGDSHPYRSSVTNFIYAREHKRTFLGRHEQEALEGDDKAVQEVVYETDSDDQKILTPSDQSDTSNDLAETGQGSDVKSIQRTRTNNIAFPNLQVYTAWQRLVSDFASRTLRRQSDRLVAMLGLSKSVESRLHDESMAGVWKGTHLLPSLLWYAEKPGGTSRISNFPTWSWASIQGKIDYTYLEESPKLDWQPSDVILDVGAADGLQSLVTGSVSFTTVVRKFASDFKFWDYHNVVGNPLMTHFDFDEIDNMSKERLLEELMVIEGYKDIVVSCDGAEEQDGGEGGDLYCAVIARVSEVPPPKFGKPVFPSGRPPTLFCLCLKLVRDGGGVDGGSRAFQRIGKCQFWDMETFWEGAVRERVVIV